MQVFAAVLAAGRGRRMGGPKHLLRIDGVPMLERVVRALLASRVTHHCVILAPGDDAGARLCEALRVEVVRAEDAAEGRAASVRAAVRAAPPEADGLLFAQADQPFLEPTDFDALIARFETGAPIVHARYAGERGSPVLFASRFAPELLALRGREGGRTVLLRHLDLAHPVDLDPSHGRDLDRPEDLGTVFSS